MTALGLFLGFFKQRGVSGGGGAARFVDDFDRSDRELNGDNGWTSTGGRARILSQVARGLTLNQNSVTTRDDTEATGIVSADLVYTGSSAYYLISRCLGTVDVITGFLTGLVGSNLRIYSGNGASYTLRSSTPLTIVDGDELFLKTTDDGTEIVGDCDNVTQSTSAQTSYVSTLYASNTRKGFRLYSTNVSVDNFTIEDV